MDLPEVVGRESRFESAWSVSDALLYALGVGAGQDPGAELELTTENTEEVGQVAVPTLISVVAQTAIMHRLGISGFPKGSLIHLEQSVTWHRDLPCEGAVDVVARVDEVRDTGVDALLRVSTSSSDRATRQLLATTRLGYLVRGMGGFGGRLPEPREMTRDPGAPVATRMLTTRPEQALIYRLSGDRNPLHADPAVAGRAGFERPILHGLCTFGFACRGLVQLLCDGDPRLLRSMSARFARPVYPGESLTVRVWPGCALTCDFDVVNSSGQSVLRSGRVEFSTPSTTRTPALSASAKQ